MFSSEDVEESMRTASTMLSAAAVLALAATSALAGPCATGTTASTAGKGQGQQAAQPGSSASDHSTKNLADGQQPDSAKTVGAMNNVAAGRATSPADVTLQAQGKPTMAQQGQGSQAGQGQQASNDKSSNTDTSTKNMAGGQQPSSPKTVGAMNNVGANQIPGQGQNDGC